MIIPKDLSPGKTFEMGTWVQGAGPSPITWQVLQVVPRTLFARGKAFVISEYGIDGQVFNSDLEKGNEWSSSDLKSWLNSEFLSSAFTSEEKAIIHEVTCLSIEEAKTLFDDDEARLCRATPYAGFEKNAPTGNGAKCFWWLRSPGENELFEDDDPFKHSAAAYVDYYGAVDSDGMPVDGILAVRPALWLDL